LAQAWTLAPSVAKNSSTQSVGFDLKD